MESPVRPHDLFGLSTQIVRRNQSYDFPSGAPGGSDTYYLGDTKRKLTIEIHLGDHPKRDGIKLRAVVGEELSRADDYQEVNVWLSWPILKEISEKLLMKIDDVRDRIREPD